MSRPYQRYCKRGHDKHAPHGGYIVKKNGKFSTNCAVCERERSRRYYREALTAKRTYASVSPLNVVV